jgi:hypothetical protein
MSDRKDLLRELVVQGHLNVSQRQVLGAVSRREVTELVKSLLLLQGAFPLRGHSNAVHDGPTLNQTSSGTEITWRRAYPWDPFTVAESQTEIFTDVDSAIKRFVESEWSSGIDGVELK